MWKALLIFLVVPLLRAEEKWLTRAHRVSKDEVVHAAHGQEGHDLNRHLVDVLESAPFESRFFGKGDRLLELTASSLGLRAKGSRLIYNEQSGHLVARALLFDHFTLQERLEINRSPLKRLTLRVLEIPGARLEDWEVNEGRYRANSRELYLVESLVTSERASWVSSGDRAIGGWCEIGEPVWKSGAFLALDLNVSIQKETLKVKISNHVSFNQSCPVLVYSSDGRKTWVVEVEVSLLDARGDDPVDWVFEEETGKAVPRIPVGLGEKIKRFEADLPDDRVRRAIPVENDFYEQVKKSPYVKEQADERVELGDDDPFSDVRFSSPPPSRKPWYEGAHEVLSELKPFGLIDLTPTLAKWKVDFSKEDFAVMERDRSMLLVEASPAAVARIRELVGSPLDPKGITFLDLCLVESQTKPGNDWSDQEHRIVKRVVTSQHCYPFDNFEFEDDQMKASAEIVGISGVENLKLAFDLAGDLGVTKEVKMESRKWVVLVSFSDKGNWQFWTARWRLERFDR